MPFFQNLFEQEWRGHLLLDDRQYVLDFAMPANKNTADYQYAWNPEPYDFSASGNLTLNYAWDSRFKNFSSLTINVTGVVPSATTALEVATLLNADPTFAELWVASSVANPGVPGSPNTVLIKSNPARKRQVRFYVSNGNAESKLRFNKKCSVAQLPSYFAKHTVANRFLPDSDGVLNQLDPTTAQDQQIITEAGLDYTNVLADWQLLAGRSMAFTFQKITVDGSNRITKIIFYPAGAGVGDLAKMTDYVYTGASSQPSQITEKPYVLQAGDLVTPP